MCKGDEKEKHVRILFTDYQFTKYDLFHFFFGIILISNPGEILTQSWFHEILQLDAELLFSRYFIQVEVSKLENL